MKHFKHSLVLLTLILAGSVTVSRAEVSVSFSTGHRYPPRYAVKYRSGPAYYHPGPRYYYARPRYSHPYRQVVAVTPVVVSQPYYVQPLPAPAPAPALSGDYGQDLSDFRDRLFRLRAVIDRQKEKGGLDASAHERFSRTLDAIEHDQRVRAYDRGGNMTSGDFAEFFRRLNEADEDIERALAS